MTQYVTYLPYMNTTEGLKDSFGHEPLRWLHSNLKGKFKLADFLDKRCTCIYFNEKQDMELFILTWGEYLWSEDDLPNL